MKPFYKNKLIEGLLKKLYLYFLCLENKIKFTHVPRFEAETGNEDPFEMRSILWGFPQKSTKDKSICFLSPNEGNT